MTTLVRLSGAAALVAALMVGAAGGASAQQSTSASYGDWVVRCVTRGKKPPRKICEMEQTTEMRGKHVPLSRIAIARPVRGRPLTLVAQLPVNVWLPTGVKLFPTAKDVGIAGRFLRCVPAGCFAEINLSDAQVKAFRAATKPARLVFKNAAGRNVAIPLSFKGFTRAFDALAKD